MPREVKGRKNRFPSKLMKMLDNAEGKYDNIVAWGGDGRSFTVLQRELFVQQVIPDFFGGIKFLSFTKQLMLWGFKRSKVRHSSTFYHPIFRRGEPESIKRMIRRDEKQGETVAAKQSEKPKARSSRGLPVESGKPAKEKTNKSFSKEESSDNHKESAAPAADETEVEEPPVHTLLARSTKVNQTSTTKDHCSIDHMHQDSLDPEATVTMEAFSSKKFRSCEPDESMKRMECDKQQAKLVLGKASEGTMNAEFSGIGDDSLNLSDVQELEKGGIAGFRGVGDDDWVVSDFQDVSNLTIIFPI